MRTLLRPLTVVAVLSAALPSLALERAPVRVAEIPDSEPWSSSAETVTLRYYNYCTGWIWMFGLYAPAERPLPVVDVCFDTGAANALLVATRELLHEPMPAGYGYTGTISILDGCGCDAQVIASQPHEGGEPTYQGGDYLQWIDRVWGIQVPQQFAIRLRGGHVGYVPGLYDYIVTDRAAAGPTGPDPVGFCYPADRTGHASWTKGADCPTIPLTDLVSGLPVEPVVEAILQTPTPVEEDSWGGVKALYR